MVLRIIIAALMLMGLVACGIAYTTEAGRLRDQVNAMLPPDRRFNPVGWHFVKYWDLREEYALAPVVTLHDACVACRSGSSFSLPAWLSRSPLLCFRVSGREPAA